MAIIVAVAWKCSLFIRIFIGFRRIISTMLKGGSFLFSLLIACCSALLWYSNRFRICSENEQCCSFYELNEGYSLEYFWHRKKINVTSNEEECK